MPYESPFCAASRGGVFSPLRNLSEIAQYMAIVRTRIKRSNRSVLVIWLWVMPKPRDLKSENMASMPQRMPVVENGVFTWSIIHGDNPWLLVARFMQSTDIGEDTRAMKLCVDETFRHQGDNLTALHFAALVLQSDVSFHA